MSEGEVSKKTISQGKKNIIERYIDKLKENVNIKLLISCRTDFVQNKGDDDLSHFSVAKASPIVKYIAPIGYNPKNSKIQTKFEEIVKSWLEKDWDTITIPKEKMELKSLTKRLTEKLKKLGLKDKMKTGLMFNMIMGIITSNDDLPNQPRLRSYEIYEKTIIQEIKLNWQKIVSSTAVEQVSKITNKRRIQVLQDEVNPVFHEAEVAIYFGNETRLKAGIEEGILRVGEVIAAEMCRTNRNRLNFYEILKLIEEHQGKQQELNLQERKNLKTFRIEWNCLYIICRILGLKLEKRYYQEKQNNEKSRYNSGSNTKQNLLSNNRKHNILY